MEVGYWGLSSRPQYPYCACDVGRVDSRTYSNYYYFRERERERDSRTQLIYYQRCMMNIHVATKEQVRYMPHTLSV